MVERLLPPMVGSWWTGGVTEGKRVSSWLPLVLALILLNFPVSVQSLNVEQGLVNHSVSANNGLLGVHGTETVRCDDVHKDPSVVTREDRCEFVKKHCFNDSISLRLIVVYYCAGDDRVSAMLVKPCIILGSLFLLIALFKVMGFTADTYFSTILSQISQDMGLPPRLAGVTLLALGNGAPDLSSSIAAIESGNIHLAMGSLVGSVMFVGCVVAGRLVSLSGGIKCRAAQMRDVLVLCFAVCAVMVIVLFGEITFAVVCMLLGIYVFYVIIVAIADFTKRAGVEWAGLLSLFSSSSHWEDQGHRTSFMERVKSSLLPQNDVLEGREVMLQYEHLPGDGNGGSNASSELEMMESPRKPGPVTERATWGGNRLRDARHDDIETDEVEEDQELAGIDSEIGTSNGRVARAATEPASPRKGRLEYDALVHMSTSEYRTRALADMSDAKTFRSIHFDDKFLERSSQLEEMLETICEDEKKNLDDRDEIEDHIEGRRPRMVRFSPPDDGPIPSESSNLKTTVLNLWKAISNAADTGIRPLKYILKGTIPMFDVACREQSWFVASCALSPLWSLMYFTEFSPSWWTLLVAICFSGIFAALSWYYTNNLVEEDIDAPMLWSCGTGFPFGTAMIAVYGFAMAAMWIDAVAGEIVGMIHVFGMIGHIKPSILGLTILAWGNSLTDLMANISMAMRSAGGASMAMTACFAGPLFNLLLGLGLGFLFYFSDAGTSSTSIEFDAIVFIGCAFAAINCIAIVVLAIANKQRLPSWVGWLMMAWYSLYMIVVISIAIPT